MMWAVQNIYVNILYEFLFLQENSLEEDCNDESYIPMEEILEFKSRHNITEKREELRQILRNNFAKLCAPQNIA